MKKTTAYILTLFMVGSLLYQTIVWAYPPSFSFNARTTTSTLAPKSSLQELMREVKKTTQNTSNINPAKNTSTLFGNNDSFITADELLCGTERVPPTSGKDLGPRLFDKRTLLGSIGHVLALFLIVATIGIEVAYLFQLVSADVLGTIFRSRHLIQSVYPLLVVFGIPFLAKKIASFTKKYLDDDSWLNTSAKQRVLRVLAEIHKDALKNENQFVLESLSYVNGIKIGTDYVAFNKRGTIAWAEQGSGVIVIKEGITVFKPLLKMLLLHEARHLWQMKHWALRYKMPERLTYIRYLERDAWQVSMNRHTILFFPVHVIVSASLFFTNLVSQFCEWIYYEFANRGKNLSPPNKRIPSLFNRNLQEMILKNASCSHLPKDLQTLIKQIRTTLSQLKKKKDTLKRFGIKRIVAITLVGTPTHNGNLFYDRIRLNSFYRTRMMVIFEGTMKIHTQELITKLGLSTFSIANTKDTKSGIMLEFTNRGWFENSFSAYYDYFPQYLPLTGVKYITSHLSKNLRKQGIIRKAPVALHILHRLLTSKLKWWTRPWAQPLAARGKELIRKNIPTSKWDSRIREITTQHPSSRCILWWSRIIGSRLLIPILFPTMMVLGIGLIATILLSTASNPLMYFVTTHPWTMRMVFAIVMGCLVHILLSVDPKIPERLWKRFITNYIDAGTGTAIAQKLKSWQAGWAYVLLVYHGYSRSKAYRMVLRKYGTTKKTRQQETLRQKTGKRKVPLRPTTSGQYKHRNLHSIDMAA